MPSLNWKEFTPDGILAVIEDLERAVIQLRAVREAMIDHDIESKELPKATQALKGIKSIGSFVRAAQDELTDHRLGIKKPKPRKK